MPSDIDVTQFDFRELGIADVAYIRELTVAEAHKQFPNLGDIPEGITLYSLRAANGAPIALTDTRSAAHSEAEEHDLEVIPVH